jgi:PLP dependent protein
MAGAARASCRHRTAPDRQPADQQGARRGGAVRLELRKEIARSGRAPRLFVQVNTGAEPQKGGVLPEEADAFLDACRTQYGLTVEGLMCIPPLEDAPAPHFALTAKIAARNGLTQLSMGMSADFAAAVAFGATQVRVGTAIFGGRPSGQRKSPDAGLGG